VLLALATDAWSPRAVLVLSAVGCFATVPAHVTATAADIAVAVVIVAVAVGAVAAAVLSGQQAREEVPSHS
jgi:hypothetical protein